jgi:hypothetical protein
MPFLGIRIDGVEALVVFHRKLQTGYCNAVADKAVWTEAFSSCSSSRLLC